MVSYHSAITLIKRIRLKREIITLDIVSALDYVCAEDISAPINFPPFNQSAMDGYAITSFNKNNEYQLINTIKAGDNAENVSLRPLETCRIFTGAMLPENTIAVVKQEDVHRSEQRIHVTKKIQALENIRPIGDQTKIGDIVLKKGNIISPGCVGLLAMLGIFNVKVFKKPSILIIATGNELVKREEKLTQGKIYESNTYTLIAALKQFGFESHAIVIADNFEKIEKKAIEAIEENDLILFTGGISVGDYDFVYEVLKKIQVTEVFYKVRQKPGKPLFFGQKENKLIFALPGNPAAVLTSFYVYVIEALSLFVGETKNKLRHSFLKLNENYSKSLNLTSFLKGKCVNDHVFILTDQSSAMLTSFVEADCLIILPEGKDEYLKNELVEVILIK